MIAGVWTAPTWAARRSPAWNQSLPGRELEFTVVLVSDAFDEIPWLERVYVAGSLWDALEMGAGADVHCYTRAEFERKRDSMPVVKDAVWHGLDLLVFI